jgi:hypothetical protein
MSTTRSTCGRLAPGMDLGCRGSGRRAWPRRPEFDQVGVWIEEVGADALRRVHVPGLLRTDGDLDALPPQMLDSAHKVCRIDLQAKVKPAGEARVIHHPRLRRAQVLRPVSMDFGKRGNLICVEDLACPLLGVQPRATPGRRSRSCQDRGPQGPSGRPRCGVGRERRGRALGPQPSSGSKFRARFCSEFGAFRGSATPDPREIQPIRGGGHGKPQCLAIQTTARVHVITDENDLLHLFDLDRVHGLLPPNVPVSEDGHDFLHSARRNPPGKLPLDSPEVHQRRRALTGPTLPIWFSSLRGRCRGGKRESRSTSSYYSAFDLL